MGEVTGIAWTGTYDARGVLRPGATFNPWIGCDKVSEACKHCYAEVSTPARKARAGGLELWGAPSTGAVRQRTSTEYWRKPLAWDRAAAKAGVRTKTFCASLADVCEDHPALPPWRFDLWRLIEATPNLDWLLLTKRPQHLLSMLPHPWLRAPRHNVWLGTTVEHRKSAEARIPHLLSVAAAVHFLSVEPQLEHVDLRAEWLHGRYAGAPTVDWIITGGESGKAPRDYDLAWARSIVAQGRDTGCAVFVKQLGANPVQEGHPYPLRLDRSHGADPRDWPVDLNVREFPTPRVSA